MKRILQLSTFALLLFALFTTPGNLMGDSDPEVVCAPENYLTPPPASEQAMRYYHSGNILWIVFQVLSVGFPLIFFFSGASGWLGRKTSEKTGNIKWRKILLFIFFYLLIEAIVNLPFSFYAGYIRPHEYDLSNQTILRWFELWGKNNALNILGGIIFLWIPIWLVGKFPRTWWLATGILSLPFFLFLLLIQPVWIEPLLNRFDPMENKSLERDVQSVLEKAGIENARVFVVDKSTDTKTVNAYVTGFLDSKRIVFWDTILKLLERDEILFVTAHEAAHYKLNHSLWSILVSSGSAIFLLYFANILYLRFAKKNKHGSIETLPLLIGIYLLLSFLYSPVLRGWSRWKEEEADRFAIKVTGLNYAGATAFLKLQQENLSNPYPGFLYTIFRASHPPLGERVLSLHACKKEVHQD